MKNKLKKGLVISLSLTIVSSFLGFVVNKVFVSSLGIENLGLIKLFNQVVFYLAILDMGLATAATVALYKPLSINDNRKVSIVFNTISIFYRKISIYVIILGILLTPSVVWLVNSSDYYYVSFYWILNVLIASLNYSLSKYSILFLADQKFVFVKLVTLGSLVIEKSVQVLVLMIFKSLTLYISISFLGFLLKYFLFRSELKKSYNLVSCTELDKSLKTSTSQLVFHKLSHIIIYNSDLVIISKFLSLSVVGVYSSYLMLSNLIVTIMGIVHSLLDPVLGKIVVEKEVFYNEKLFFSMLKLSLFLSGFVFCVLYSFGNDFVTLWLGKDFLLEDLSLFLISLVVCVEIVKWPIEVYKYKYGYFKDIYSPIIEVSLNLIISLTLVSNIGLNGVILGTIISGVIVSFFIKPYLLFKYCFNRSFFSYFSSFVVDSALCFFISSFIVFYLPSVWGPISSSTWGSFLISIISSALLMCSLFVFVYLIFPKNRQSYVTFLNFLRENNR
ncbi:lipopolysaccharide biosynthesis protein [Vibrio furnissii]|uniref:lipopolysaccharide biosynthesis protein n=1 Tax=Vibrio furnissii TaxID=29494 RepID=UPI003AA94447